MSGTPFEVLTGKSQASMLVTPQVVGDVMYTSYQPGLPSRFS